MGQQRGLRSQQLATNQANHAIEGCGCFSSSGILTFGSSKVDDIAVRLEHVNFLNRLNWLNIKLLQLCL
jgi:hypothetical protein